MRYQFDTEEEQDTRKRGLGRSRRGQSSDTEITLGTRSLLGIFFGLVLICGTFFGLGYSVGRVGSSHAANASPGDTPGPLANDQLQKPLAGQTTLTPVPAPAPTDTNGAAPTQDNPAAPTQNAAGTPPPGQGSPAGGTPAPAPAQDSGVPNPAPAPSPAPAPTLAPAALTTPPPAPGTFMVQVAAVRVAQDANILVAALKEHGYDAVVRNEPQDQLLHVQLGPFTTRAAAMAMRARLLADGYNAVLK